MHTTTSGLKDTFMKKDEYKKSNIYSQLHEAQNEMIKDYSAMATDDHNKLKSTEPSFIKRFELCYSHPNNYLYNKKHISSDSSRHTQEKLEHNIPQVYLDKSNPNQAAKLIDENIPLSYAPPIWDIDRPQPALSDWLYRNINKENPRYVQNQSVLEVGCGSGENIMLWSKLRFKKAEGIDIISGALDEAKKKSKERGYGADIAFHKFDALQLESFGRLFDIVLDIGFFHFLINEENKLIYRQGLHNTIKKGGELLLLVLSDKEPEPSDEQRTIFNSLNIPPIARVSEADIRNLFTSESGWEIERIESTFWETHYHKPPGAMAYFCVIKHTVAGPREQVLSYTEINTNV